MASSSMRIKLSTLKFEIDYYKTKDLPIKKYITSPIFSAGGYNWLLKFYPQGNMPELEGSHASLFLYLKSEAKNITAEYDFKVLNKKGDAVKFVDAQALTFKGYDSSWGAPNLIRRVALEDLYCVNGILLISCDIRVLTEPSIAQDHPGNLCMHIERLWEKGERFDVFFEVEGESIPTHKFMLAARSPVFKTELFGPMEEPKLERIKINEMEAEVFKALLHFVYTDNLDDIEELCNHDQTLLIKLLQCLFVAADRYALNKLTLLCAEQMTKNLSVDMVMITLLLADRHSCPWLKNKCPDFASGARSFFAELSEKVMSLPPFAKKTKDCLGDSLNARIDSG